VQAEYKLRFKRSLVDHIEGETSFSYKKLLLAAAHDKATSRCLALQDALKNQGNDRKKRQFARVLGCATLKERQQISERYVELFSKELGANGLIEYVASKFDSVHRRIFSAFLKVIEPEDTNDAAADLAVLQGAMEEAGEDQADAAIAILARRTPLQMEGIAAEFQRKSGTSLADRLKQPNDTFASPLFKDAEFRAFVAQLLLPPMERLADAAHYCLEGWGTDNTGLITCLVHLSEQQRRRLLEAYASRHRRDLAQFVKSDTSGDFEFGLVTCLRAPCEVYSEAIRRTTGLTTNKRNLINWMCIAKDRMDQVRTAFAAQNSGQQLVDLVKGSDDFRSTLASVATRVCTESAEQAGAAAVGCGLPPAPSQAEAVFRFNSTVNDLCRMRQASTEPLVIPERQQQELACAFMFWGSKSGVAPNLDRPAVGEMLRGLRMEADPSALPQVFRTWDSDGDGAWDWNDFVRFVAAKVNDPGFADQKPLGELI